MAFNFYFTGVSNKDICLNCPKDSPFSSLMESLTNRGIDISSYFFVHNGSPVDEPLKPLEITPSENDSQLVIVRAYPQLLGGKGGFGALIRAMGMRMNRNRNKDACRDLSGRRLRTVNAEKKMAELMKKEPERKKKEAEKKSERRRLMLEGPRHQFNDTDYIEQLESSQENLEEAMKQGLAAGSSSSTTEAMDESRHHYSIVGGKRKGPEKITSNKRRKIWMGDDGDLDLSEEENDEKENEETPVISSSDSDSSTLIVPVQHEEVPVINSVPIELEETPVINSVPIETPVFNSVPIQHEVAPVINSVPVQHEEAPVINSPTPLTDHAHQSPSTSDTVTMVPGTDDNATTTTDINPSVTDFSYDDFDMNAYESMEELEKLGADILKTILQKKGLKCGGTLRERSARLWSVKGKKLDEIDPTLLASSGNGKRSRNKGKKK